MLAVLRNKILQKADIIFLKLKQLSSRSFFCFKLDRGW